MEIVDFTHTIKNNMSVYCEEEKVNINKISNIKEHGYELRELNIFTHTGTHVDSPRHMCEEGKYIDEYDLKELIGKAIILNVEKTSLTMEGLKGFEEEIKGKDFILLNTGYFKHWGSETYLTEYPQLTLEGAKYLSSFNIKGVGIDCISIGKGESEGEVHKEFMKKGSLIMENLNFTTLIKGEFNLVIAPLKIHHSDGAPSRVFGMKI